MLFEGQLQKKTNTIIWLRPKRKELALIVSPRYPKVRLLRKELTKLNNLVLLLPATRNMEAFKIQWTC